MKNREPFVLVLDHFDSFTYNLVQYVEERGVKALVVRTNAQFSEIADLKPDRIILSPGEGHPKDVSLYFEALDFWAGKIPVLGVCLGHQAIAMHAGAGVTRNFRQMHGKTSLIGHSQSGIFKGLPSPLEVCRYHSLGVERDEVERFGLEVLSVTEEGDVMAIANPKFPNLYGVQFHPESYFTQEGGKIIGNFLNL
jgi:anthranilate synthase/aminodeoxychorismate synthase-like glutamine amidotransferase